MGLEYTAIIGRLAPSGYFQIEATLELGKIYGSKLEVELAGCKHPGPATEWYPPGRSFNALPVSVDHYGEHPQLLAHHTVMHLLQRLAPTAHRLRRLRTLLKAMPQHTVLFFKH